MIINEDSNTTIKDADMLDWLGAKEVQKLKVAEQSSKLKLSVPEKFMGSKKENRVYKVGFLRTFLKALYPEDSYKNIVDIMNERYQLFLGKRQVERYVKEYQKDEKYR